MCASAHAVFPVRRQRRMAARHAGGKTAAALRYSATIGRDGIHPMPPSLFLIVQVHPFFARQSCRSRLLPVPAAQRCTQSRPSVVLELSQRIPSKKKLLALFATSNLLPAFTSAFLPSFLQCFTADGLVKVSLDTIFFHTLTIPN